MKKETVITFNAIGNFVNEIQKIFGKRFHSLSLYDKLLQHTQFCHEEFVQKHIDLFTQFCRSNREAIMSQDKSKLRSPNIVYKKDKIYINMKSILNASDSEIEGAIWEHLLAISALVDTNNGAKEILRKIQETHSETQSEDNPEDQFFQEMTQMAGNIDLNNPQAMIGTAMQFIPKFMQGMQSGQLDLNKLLQNVAPGLDMGQLMSVAGNIASKMEGGQGDGEQKLDMNEIIKGVSGILGQGMPGIPTEVVEVQKESEGDEEPPKEVAVVSSETIQKMSQDVCSEGNGEFDSMPELIDEEDLEEV